MRAKLFLSFNIQHFLELRATASNLYPPARLRNSAWEDVTLTLLKIRNRNKTFNFLYLAYFFYSFKVISPDIFKTYLIPIVLTLL